MTFNLHFILSAAGTFVFDFRHRTCPCDTERCSPVTAVPKCPCGFPEEFTAHLCRGQSASDHPVQVPELLPVLLLLPCSPLLWEHHSGEQGRCEGGDDTQRQPRAAGTLQDLSQGSREGGREAAGSDPPYEVEAARG